MESVNNTDANSSNLKKSAQKVQEFLAQQGKNNCTVVELSSSTRTAQDAAASIGCTVGQIVKSMIFCTAESKQPILVLVSGSNRVNEKALQKIIGEKIVRPNADFVRNVTGFAIGGVPPVAHKQTLKTYIDQDLMGYDLVWAAAGTPHAVFSIAPQDLVGVTKGDVISLV